MGGSEAVKYLERVRVVNGSHVISLSTTWGRDRGSGTWLVTGFDTLETMKDTEAKEYLFNLGKRVEKEIKTADRKSVV